MSEFIFFFTRQTNKWDNDPQYCGILSVIYSDDNGVTFSPKEDIPMWRNKYDYPNRPDVPKHFVVWQVPIKHKNSKYLAGYTQWVSPIHHSGSNGQEDVKEYIKQWFAWEARAYYMRFENLDDNPLPSNIEITYLPEDENGIEVKQPNRGWSTAEEPSVVLLANGELFATVRPYTGYLYYVLSKDNGVTFTKPKRLRYNDGEDFLRNPRAPAPIYKLKDGRFLLVFHNNDGKIGAYNQLSDTWKETIT